MMRRCLVFSNNRRHIHSSSVIRGALTSKPYAFVARPWELQTTDAIDNTNAIGANIVLQTRGNEVLRILPRTNDDVNEEWIDDKTRFCYDGLRRQRLTKPLCRDLENPTKWDPNNNDWRDIFKRISNAFNGFGGRNNMSVRAVTGASADMYSILALSDFLDMLSPKNNPTLESVGSKPGLNADIPASYRFNSTIAGIEDADTVLLVGTNLYVDAPLLCSRLRKGFLRDKTKISCIGFRNDVGFPVSQLGLTPETLLSIAEGKHPYSAVLQASKKPMIIVGSSIFNRKDGKALAGTLEALAQFANVRQVDPATNKVVWNGLNVVHNNANDVGILDLGRSTPFVATGAEKVDVLYLMGVGAEDLPNGLADVQKLREDAKFIIFQGSHGDELASVADVILPGSAFSEKTGIYINLEGRPQKSRHALTPPGIARNDWKIIRALSEVVENGECALPYDTEDKLHERLSMLIPSVKSLGQIEKPSHNFIPDNFWEITKELVDGQLLRTPFTPQKHDFHLQGHPVARASQTMAKCSKEFLPLVSNFI